MALTPEEATKQAKAMHGYREAELSQLNVLRRYWKGRQRLLAVIPSSAPTEVKVMARIARVNIIKIAIDVLAQATFVDGFRGVEGGKPSDTNTKVWDIWQANKMDKGQSGINRATFAYGVAYAVVLPGTRGGKNVPVIRGCSPRALTVLYGDDPDWPVYAWERRSPTSWRLYDSDTVYEFTLPRDDPRGSQFQFVSASEHGAGVTPVVRFLDEEDLDCDDEVTADMQDRYWEKVPTRGQVAPLMDLQDQINLTTFGLLVAQWFSAFKQRWIIGWVPEDEAQRLKAGASLVWTFKDSAQDTDGAGGVKVGEFSQTDLGGYIESREASLRHAATTSQTPVHELLGELVNLSAEALAAAENGHERKVSERKTSLGESYEQVLRLAGDLAGIEVPEDAQVVWRDTSARTFSATVDALGKMVVMLGVPAQEVWEKIPNVTQQDVERWKATAATGDAFAQLNAILERQNKTQAPDSAPPGGTQTYGE